MRNIFFPHYLSDEPFFLVKLILWCRTMLGLLGLTKNKRADIHVYIYLL